MSQTKNTFSESGTFLLNTGGQGVGPDGLALLFTETGTQSMVLKVNTAPPGATPSYTNIPYLNGSLVSQSAGTAITASGLVYVSAEYAALDLYGTLTATSGSLVVQVMPANLPEEFNPVAIVGNITQTGTEAALVQSTTSATELVGSGSGSSFSQLLVRSAAGQYAILGVTTGALNRWTVFKDNDAEAGANAGATLRVAAYDDAGAAIDNAVSIVRAAAGAVQIAAGRPFVIGGAPGGATTDTKFVKAVTAIPNNTATALATITVPNTAQTAVIRLTVNGSLGAGGAIGAGEASASNSYNLTIVRTAGVNAVGTMSSAFGAAAAAVAGAATVTATLTLSSVTGAVGATNTFTINGTIARSGGSSDNHTARLLVEVVNANASGITVA